MKSAFDGAGSAAGGDTSLQSVVRRIAAGKDHSLAITYAGAVFTWGRGDSGQLGHGSYMDVAQPTQVMALSASGGDGADDVSSAHNGVRVIDADGGSDFSLFLGSTGAAFISGRDPSVMQVTDHPAVSASSIEAEDAAWLFPQLMNLSGSGRSPSHEAIAAVVAGVSCGEAHFALHLSSGSVLVFGSSVTGDSDRVAEDGEDASAQPASRRRRHFQHVEALQSVKRAICGGSHTLVLS